MRKTFALAGAIGLFFAGFLGAYAWLGRGEAAEEQIVNSSVLLERVQQVCKLVTVEGQFSELYDETNIRKFTVYVPMPSTFSFSKQAILKVEGKVLVGYDLSKIRVTADSTRRQVLISNIPEPEILSVDHQVAYKNLSESFFNTFSAEDYTRLNANAKAMLAQKAQESRLMQEAALEGNQLLEIMKFIVEAAGWTLAVEQPAGAVVPIDSLPAERLLQQ